jgi:FkbM family methyltransferase
MIGLVKIIAGRLPGRSKQELKRLLFARRIRNGSFMSNEHNEREFERLPEWVADGDWAIDVGANFGSYSARLSELVGPTGRVISLEPLPGTFELLVANMALLPHQNMTLLNVAASDRFGVGQMSVPSQANGEPNPYMAHLSGRGALPVVCLPIDSLHISARVTLIKIDVEGHELAALEGMRQLLTRDHPTLIVEGRDSAVAELLASLGYSFEEAPKSPNRVFRAA